MNIQVIVQMMIQMHQGRQIFFFKIRKYFISNWFKNYIIVKPEGITIPGASHSSNIIMCHVFTTITSLPQSSLSLHDPIETGKWVMTVKFHVWCLWLYRFPTFHHFLRSNLKWILRIRFIGLRLYIHKLRINFFFVYVDWKFSTYHDVLKWL